MGQQQLLLVILVTVIVGIATVVAINTFSSASESANRDAVTNDMVAIAAASQAYFIKPEMLNGGGNSFDGITFRDLAFAADSMSEDFLTAWNTNGMYEFETVTDSTIALLGHPTSCAGYTRADGCDADGQISATVSRDDIEWEEEES